MKHKKLYISAFLIAAVNCGYSFAVNAEEPMPFGTDSSNIGLAADNSGAVYTDRNTATAESKEMSKEVAAETNSKVKIPEDDKGILSVVWENDIFNGTDSNYTNGGRIGWLTSEKDQPAFVNWVANHLLPGSDDVKSNNRVSVAVGQNIYTPSDTTVRTPIKSDRPYAGYTYGSIGIVADTGKTLDSALLSLGVVGPASGAEQTQKFIHSAIGNDIPQGWNNQLKNEPTAQLDYERKWRNLYELSPFGLGVDATPHVGLSLGNVNTSAATGVTFRVGYDLPSDYGPPRIRPSLPGSDFFVPSKTLGGYLFTSFEGRAVGRNIFLDGNTFEDGPSVDKNWFVGDAQAGIAMTYGDTRLSYTQVFNTKEFKHQDASTSFGVVSLSVRY